MSGFRRAGLRVLLGSAAGAALALALTPVLSRLVTPGVFGSFMTLVALASVFVGVSTMRLEVAGQAEPDEDDARAVLGLGMTLAILTGAAITVVTAVAWVLGAVSALALIVGPLVTIASTQLIGTAWLARQRSYGALAGANFVQNGGMTVAQTAFAAVSPTIGALTAGFLASRLHWLRHIPSVLWHRAAALRTWRRHQAYALTAGTSAGINSLAGQVPILLPALVYGDQAAGWFAMALRILVSPLALVGEAAAAAAVGEISQALRTRSGEARSVLRRGLLDLLLVGAIPALLAGTLGVAVVPLILGDQWEQTGGIVAALAVGAWAQFAVAPFSQTLNLSGHSRWLLVWDVARLVGITAAFVIPGLLGSGIVAAALCYSGTMIGLYAALVVACDRSLTGLGERRHGGRIR